MVTGRGKGLQLALARAASIYVPEDWRYAMSRQRQLAELTDGAALFADISGFTPLTETLNRALGPRRGAEELTSHLNRVFDALIGEVDRFGGSVVSFAGDAITCWFAGDLPPGASTPSALRATACALAMQRQMARFGEIAIPGQSPAALTLKVSVASGRARRFVVGDPQVQLIPLLAGETLARMAAGEHKADKGEVVVDEPTARQLGDRVIVTDWRAEDETGWRFAVVDQLTVAVESERWPSLAVELLAQDDLRRWVLPPIYKRLQAGLGEFLTELRPSVALFMRFGGIEVETDPDAGRKLDAYIHWVQQVATSYDGTVLVVLFGDKGSYLYIAFGAPIAHEDDVRRACRAALELRRLPSELDFVSSVQIGISGGTMLAGAYGGSTRRTYGTLGDEVNLAARLMQHAAPGEVLVSQRAQQVAQDDFHWDSLPPVRVKGKSEALNVYSLRDSRHSSTIHLQEPRYALPMVGREEELGLIKEKLELAMRGKGQIIGITAEAGLGKSRLVAEAVGLADGRGAACYGGECQSYGTNTAYLAWRPVWQSIFGLDPAASTNEQVMALNGYFATIAPSFLPRLPLLGVVLNLPIPDNELTRSFDAKLRKSSLEALLVDCLRLNFATAPAAIVLEDCHWLDPLSEDLLEAVARAMSDLPVLLLLAYRPLVASTGRPPLRGVAQLPYFGEVRLCDLPADQVGRLVALKLGVTLDSAVEVPGVLLERIVARAQGNPFYVEELLNYLKDRGIDAHDPRAIEQLELPTSLHSLILSRIDQVSESQKITLKVAAIIGRLFRFNWLWGVYPDLGGPDTVRADLDGLSRLDITSLDQPDPELIYLFKHIVTQEVAYDSQPFATRVALHDTLGQFIERTYAGALDQFIDLLAFHFDRSENQQKRREYLRRAGEIAQAAYANAAAIDYYLRVLPLLEGFDLADVRMRLGRVLEVVGDWQRADECYRLALDLASARDDLSTRADAEKAIGWLLRKRGDYAAAHQYLRQAQADFGESGDSAGLSQVLADIGEVYRMQGLFADARLCYDESFKLADTLVDTMQRQSAMAQALRGSGAVAALQGDNEAARRMFDETLALQRSLGNKPGVAAALNNLAVVARRQRDEEGALRLNDECMRLFRELGDKWGLGVLLNNQGCVLTDLGRYDEAGLLLEESVAIGRQLGDKQRVARALGNLADLALDSGRYDKVWTYAEEGLRLSVELGDRTAVAYLIDDICGLAAATGRPEKALRLGGFAEALRSAAQMALAPQEATRVDRILEPARKSCGDEAAAFWQEGKGIDFDDAIAYALANYNA